MSTIVVGIDVAVAAALLFAAAIIIVIAVAVTVAAAFVVSVVVRTSTRRRDLARDHTTKVASNGCVPSSSSSPPLAACKAENRLLRGTIVNRTYGTDKNPCIFLVFTNNIWFYLLWPPVIANQSISQLNHFQCDGVHSCQAFFSSRRNICPS